MTPVLDNQNYKGIEQNFMDIPTMAKMSLHPWIVWSSRSLPLTIGGWGSGANIRKSHIKMILSSCGDDMISDFGFSAFTHRTTHVNDRMVCPGGWRHHEGTDIEAFAQGILQTICIQSNKNIRPWYQYDLWASNDRTNGYNTNPNDLSWLKLISVERLQQHLRI